MFSAILTIGAMALVVLIGIAWLSRVPKDLSGPYAKIVADSITEAGHRLTTMEVRFHRFVLAEFNTHSIFVRNSASSRAIPVKKQIRAVWSDPALPLRWPSEQAGMQGGDGLTDRAVRRSQRLWVLLARVSVIFAWALHKIGVHKSVTNRILEPFMWHTVVVTSAHWQNFFHQRCSDLAQREIQVPAELMREELKFSVPDLIAPNGAHLPYIDDATLAEVEETFREEPVEFLMQILCSISAARCARVSYLTHDGVRDLSKDLLLFERLVTASPKHWSPLAHVAVPCSDNVMENRSEVLLIPDYSGNAMGLEEISLEGLPRLGQFPGWLSYRHIVEAYEGENTHV